jgi:hypothetical protein
MPWIDDEDLEHALALNALLQTMSQAARQQAKKTPSPSGLYAVSVVLNERGELMTAAGQEPRPVVFVPPFGVAAVNERGQVELYHPDQHVSPNALADMAAVDKATIYREIARGHLPSPTQRRAAMASIVVCLTYRSMCRSWFLGLGTLAVVSSHPGMGSRIFTRSVSSFRLHTPTAHDFDVE